MRNQIRGSLLLLALLSPVFAGAQAQYTLGAYCRMLEQMQTRYSGNATARESLAADHTRYCADLDWNSNADTHFSGTVNPYLSNNPDNVAGAGEIRAFVERSETASSIIEKYRAARESATQLMTECHARSARSFEAPRAEAADVMALLTGEANATRVNSGCGRIGGFESGAEMAQSNARRQCEDLQAQCRSMVNAVDESFRELRGTGTTTPEMNVARSVAYNACNVMVDSALNQGLNISRTRADLDRACNDARRRLAEAPATPTPEAPKTAEKPATTGQGGDFWSTAAQMLPQALSILNAANEPATDLATGETLPTTVAQQPALYSSDPGSLSPGAVKGDGLDNGSLSRSATDPIMMGEEEPLTAPGRRSVSGSMPQQASGVTGTPSASGLANAAGADARRRAGNARGSRFDTDVYAGALAGAGPSRTGFAAGGYPEAGKLRGRARPAAARGMSVAEVNARFQEGLRKFLPTAAGRRPTALTPTGPDGITGPHSNLFWKVSKRYQVIPFPLAVPAPSK
ncbi:MAG: hypothetical protein KF767_12920 [Bdellovibrionaceae bacterium]|nr:hypothetical protein [Pseudobdellovibrionaceae bacterium]